MARNQFSGASREVPHLVNEKLAAQLSCLKKKAPQSCLQVARLANKSTAAVLTALWSLGRRHSVALMHGSVVL